MSKANGFSLPHPLWPAKMGFAYTGPQLEPPRAEYLFKKLARFQKTIYKSKI